MARILQGLVSFTVSAAPHSRFITGADPDCPSKHWKVITRPQVRCVRSLRNDLLHRKRRLRLGPEIIHVIQRLSDCHCNASIRDVRTPTVIFICHITSLQLLNHIPSRNAYPGTPNIPRYTQHTQHTIPSLIFHLRRIPRPHRTCSIQPRQPCRSASSATSM